MLRCQLLIECMQPADCAYEASWLCVCSWLCLCDTCDICSNVLSVFIVVYAKRHMCMWLMPWMNVARVMCMWLMPWIIVTRVMCGWLMLFVIESMTKESNALRLKVVVIKVMHDQSWSMQRIKKLCMINHDQCGGLRIQDMPKDWRINEWYLLLNLGLNWIGSMI